jgi:hypothetical protein
MIKNITLITFLTIIALTLTLFQGCLISGTHHRYEYQKDRSIQEGLFIPHLYIDNNTKETSLPLLRIDKDELPHNIVMTLQVVYKSHKEDIVSFVVNNLSVQYEDGTAVNLITATDPIEQRSFDMKVQYSEHVFTGAIVERKDLTIFFEGYSVKTTGEKILFKTKQVYKYKKEIEMHTIFREWADV